MLMEFNIHYLYDGSSWRPQLRSRSHCGLQSHGKRRFRPQRACSLNSQDKGWENRGTGIPISGTVKLRHWVTCLRSHRECAILPGTDPSSPKPQASPLSTRSSFLIVVGSRSESGPEPCPEVLTCQGMIVAKWLSVIHSCNFCWLLIWHSLGVPNQCSLNTGGEEVSVP